MDKECDWAVKRRRAIDFVLNVRFTGDTDGASRFLSDDVDGFHDDAPEASKVLKGRAAVLDFIAHRPPLDRPLEIIDLPEGTGSILVYLRGQWTTAVDFDFDDQGRAIRIRQWQSVGADFGRP